jgi:hypothetical protein
MSKINHKKILERDIAINLESTKEKEMAISVERLAEIIVKSLGDDSYKLAGHIQLELIKQAENKAPMGFTKS